MYSYYGSSMLLVLTSKLICYPEINPMRKGEPTISKITSLCCMKLAIPLTLQYGFHHNVEKLNMECFVQRRNRA